MNGCNFIICKQSRCHVAKLRNREMNKCSHKKKIVEKKKDYKREVCNLQLVNLVNSLVLIIISAKEHSANIMKPWNEIETWSTDKYWRAQKENCKKRNYNIITTYYLSIHLILILIFNNWQIVVPRGLLFYSALPFHPRWPFLFNKPPTFPIHLVPLPLLSFSS